MAAASPELDVVVGLGSNLGDRRAILSGGVHKLGALGRITAVSSAYETDPIGPAQPTFLNGAVRLHTREAPLELLRRMLEIERAAGRVRLERWGPRTLDLDLLWIDGLSLDLPGLTVPHRELPSRAFALLPLVEVAPAAVDPRSGRPYTDLLSTVSGQGVRRLAERLDFGLNSPT